MDTKTEIKKEAKEFWQFVKNVREEVDNWPDYMKVDGYVARKWTLKKKGERNTEKKKTENETKRIQV